MEAELNELEASRGEEQELLEECVKEIAEFVLERKNQAIQPARFAVYFRWSTECNNNRSQIARLCGARGWDSAGKVTACIW